jgi:N-hydroxyarylamine O-acetyltransferase
VTNEPTIFERYLSILGVEAGPPGIKHLSRLVQAQIMRVPFENITKLWLKKTRGATSIPNLEEHLEGIERHNFGGTCYANNPFFAQLLRHLGYDVTICGADMSKPDVHVVSIVRLDDREYLADVGYGAPFYDPMPRDLDRDLEIDFGTSRFVLRSQDTLGRSKMDMHRDGELIHGYLVNPEPRKTRHFARVIRESYSDEATFMNVLVVERFFVGRSVRFHNLTLSESTPETTKITQLADREELGEAVKLHCEIDADIVREAIAGIPLRADIYS